MVKSMDWMNFIAAIISGLVVTVPLVVKLVEYAQKVVKERNWNEIVKLALNYMTVAEKKFADGATRKEWVVSMVKTSAGSIDYELDETALSKISEMIDGICQASKIINTPNQDMVGKITFTGNDVSLGFISDEGSGKCT